MVGGLAGQAARHLPHELFARGDDADKRPAVARGQAEALPLHGHDIGLGRRPHDAQRNRFGNGYDQQRLFGMGDLRELWYLLEHAEEVWRLHHHGGSCVIDRSAKRRRVDLAGGSVGDLVDLQADVARIGGQHVAVLGVQGASHDCLVAPGEALRH